GQVTASTNRLSFLVPLGILAQKTRFKTFRKYGRSYIAASYVKFVESAGARVLFTCNNTLFFRVLFPGGGASLSTSQYARVKGPVHINMYLNYSMSTRFLTFLLLIFKSNDKIDYFPVWGTCLGHQALTYFTSEKNLLVRTKTGNISLPLTFTTAAKDSRMFQNFPDDLLQKLATEPLTAHFHKWSLSMKDFRKNEKLRNFYKVLTTNTDGKIEFASTMEGTYKYPFYGVQWHPEKNPFEWKNVSGIPHSPSAVKVTYYLADFLVNEARKSLHHFPSKDEEAEALIYNYVPVFSSAFSVYQQIYFFA
uniref:folate gamma-glutamyl hydrolase n=1 Tax=Gopherus evgoodei TaxID=1825980 RepID=A0A8C4XWE9_9SAUR